MCISICSTPMTRQIHRPIAALQVNSTAAGPRCEWPRKSFWASGDGRPRRVLPATFGALGGGGLILVKTLSGQTITIDCSEAALVKFLTKKIRAKTGIPRAAEFYLIFRGRRMEDKMPLFQYGVSYGATIWMVVRVRGGAKSDPVCKKQTTETRVF